MLTEKEKETRDWYDQNAVAWANQRKKFSEPSFFKEEYEQFKLLKKSEGKFLELGSGSGREATEWIQMGYEYFGIDTSQNMLEIAKKAEPRGQFFHTSVYEMPFTKEFDAFSSWSMLPHIPKDRIQLALQAIQKTLKKEALGFIAMREGSGEKKEEGTNRFFSYYSLEEFAQILKKCGFAIAIQGRKYSRPDLTWLTFIVQLSCQKADVFHV